jgi:hypothetical protein
MEAMISKIVGEIPVTAKRGLEDLLGRVLQPDQRVLVVVLSPSKSPEELVRREAVDGLRQLIASAQRHADEKGVTDDEIDSAVEEAMAHVRRRA